MYAPIITNHYKRAINFSPVTTENGGEKPEEIEAVTRSPNNQSRAEKVRWPLRVHL